MKGHNLMQAIARVNRVFRDKKGGLVVDYIGIAENLKRAIAAYTQKKETEEVDTSQAIKLMLDGLDVLKEILHGLDYTNFFMTHKASERAAILCRVMDFIFGLSTDRQKDYCKTVAELAAAYSLCATSAEGMEHAAEVGFHKAVRGQVMKFLNPETTEKKKSSQQLDREINELISRSIKSETVIDLINTGELERPNIGILDDTFLEGMKNLPQKNLALEMLKRLLNGEIKGYRKRNVVKSKKFSVMLAEAVKKYHNNAVDTTKVIQELIELAKQIRQDRDKRNTINLTDEELAFYDALSDNESARTLMDDITLQQIAKELTQAIRANLTVDWSVRKSVQAKMRIIVKKLLKKYKYPPDETSHAVDVVLEQTKLMCTN